MIRADIAATIAANQERVAALQQEMDRTRAAFGIGQDDAGQQPEPKPSK